MRRNALLPAVLISALLLSCNDSKEVAGTPDVSHYKTVGMKIPTDMGARWIEAYNSRNETSGRILGLTYSINKDQLQSSLNSVTSLVGIAFHYGIDELGATHIVAIPVDETLSLWSNVEGRKYIDANFGVEISQSVASAWADRYKAQYPDQIWFHYFGRNIFDEIFSGPEFTSLNIAPALNDLDLSPELLLIVGNAETLLLGRTSSATDVYDASYPCPRCEVQ